MLIKRYGKCLLWCCCVTKMKNKNEIDCKFVKSDLNVFIMIVIYLFYDFGVIVFPYCGKFSQFQNMKLMTKC